MYNSTKKACLVGLTWYQGLSSTRCPGGSGLQALIADPAGRWRGNVPVAEVALSPLARGSTGKNADRPDTTGV